MGEWSLVNIMDKFKTKKQTKSLDDVRVECKIKEKRQRKQIQSLEMQIEEVERLAKKHKLEGDLTKYKQVAKEWKVMQSQLSMKKKSLEKIVDIRSSIEAKNAMKELDATTKEILELQALEKELGLDVDAEKLANDFMKIENSTSDFLDTLELCEDEDESFSIAMKELDAKLDAEIAGERIQKQEPKTLDL